MVDISSLSVVVAAVSVVAGVIYYSFQLRNQTRMRQTDLIRRAYSTLSSKEFWGSMTKLMMMKFEDYNNYRKKYAQSPTGFSEKPEVIALSTVGVFYQGIGVLLQKKLVDISLVAKLFRNSAIYS